MAEKINNENIQEKQKEQELLKNNKMNILHSEMVRILFIKVYALSATRRIIQ